jgi:phosphoglucomutase
MQEKMRGLRDDPPKDIAGYPVERVVDYQQDDTGLPRSNVLRFFLKGGLEAVARPSGTEPKLKVYLTAIGQTRAESAAVADRLSAYFEEWSMA